METDPVLANDLLQEVYDLLKSLECCASDMETFLDNYRDKIPEEAYAVGTKIADNLWNESGRAQMLMRWYNESHPV